MVQMADGDWKASSGFAQHPWSIPCPSNVTCVCCGAQSFNVRRCRGIASLLSLHSLSLSSLLCAYYHSVVIIILWSRGDEWICNIETMSNFTNTTTTTTSYTNTLSTRGGENNDNTINVGIGSSSGGAAVTSTMHHASTAAAAAAATTSDVIKKVK
jgi:hypothetical protein